MKLNRDELVQLDKEQLLDILLGVINQLIAENAELKAKLAQNSQNSSKPPSSDGYKKPKPKSMRQPSGRKPGGQPGHKGHGLKLPDKVNEIRRLAAETCHSCNRNLNDVISKVIGSRYLLDIPPIEAHITRFDRTVAKCPDCGIKNEGAYPVGINSAIQYGENIKAFATSLVDYGMVSVERTREIIAGAFGISMSTGTIQSFIYECAEQVSDTVESIKGHLINSPVAGFDETGFRVEGKLHWMHVASNALYTYITVHPKRGRAAIEHSGILPIFSGIAVHDCWKPYFSYTACLHALCNAHLLRELTAVYEQTGQSWATDMLQLLLDMKADCEKLKQGGATFIPMEDMQVFRKAYENIICEGLSQNSLPERQERKAGRLKRSKARCLLDRLIEHQEKILLFANDFQVPFDNNQSERDIRIFKVKQKVSGGLRSIDGAISFAKVSSYIQTAKKLGSKVFNALRSAFLGTSFDVVFG